MKYAIIDIGTNSVRYMLAEFINNNISPLYTAKSTTRLGEGLYTDERKMLPKPMALTADAVKSFSSHARAQNADKIICIATSAVRDSSNSRDFAELLKNTADVELRILSGNDEALCGFTGAVGLKAPDDTLLVDIGGGSTELIRKNNENIDGVSYNCGCVRLNELFKGDCQKANEFIRSEINVPQARNIVWIGGTASTVAMIYRKLSEYEFNKVHNTSIPKEYIFSLTEKCLTMSQNELSLLCSFDTKRAEILIYGLLVISHILKKTNADSITVSEKGLMDGIILLDN